MKVLILRFSSIGDIVLTTPVIRCLKKQIGAEIHYLTKAQYAPVLEPNPYIDKVYSFQKDPGEVLPALGKERYDRLIDLHKNLRSLRIKRALGWPGSTFDKLNIEKWLLVNTGINLLPHVHIVDRYMQAVRKLGVDNDGEGLDYFIPPDQEVDLQQHSELLTAGNYTAFVLGATHATKRLPPLKAAEICRKMDQPVALLGGKQEEATAKAIVGANVVNLCGRLTLHQSASVVRQSAVVLTHDTGLMHIAGAFRKPIVSVWGNTVPEFGMYPYYPAGTDKNTSVEVKGLSCRPCSKIGFEKCPKKHFRCMLDIPDQSIVDALHLPK